MKLLLTKLLFTILFLSAVAAAADRTKGAFLTNATEGSYTFPGGAVWGYLDATAYTDPTGVRQAYLIIYFEDAVSFRFLSGSGYVPVSTLKVTGKGLSMNIADLRQLPGFAMWEYGFPLQIPLNCTIQKTSIWEEDSIGKYTERVPQPDGTTTLYKTMSKYTHASAYTEGNLADYSFPAVSNYSASLWFGNYKSHFVP